MVQSLAAGGDGLARVSGRPLFIRGAAPGDRLRVGIVARRRGYDRAEIREVLAPGPDRVAAPCPVFGRCGGCQWQHIRYAAQLHWKREIVRQAFARIGRLDVAVGEVIPCADPWRYRHKVAVPFTPAGAGFYARGSHDVVPFEQCAIEHPLLDEVVAAVRRTAAQHRLPAYDEGTRRGLLRHLVARCNRRGDQAVAALVIHGERLPDEGAIAAGLMAAVPALRGVVKNINLQPGNVILGERSAVLAGSDAIVEEVDGLRFLISAESFFQVNPAQAAVLHNLAASAARGGDLVFDLYAGVGAIALRLARQASEVVAIEVAPAAVADGKRNAVENDIGNVQYICDRAESILPGFPRRPDAVVLDPPRKGAHPDVLRAIAAAAPERVVYVSCDPATLARDSRLLADAGYRVDGVQPLDMFPQTAHVECVARFLRSAE